MNERNDDPGEQVPHTRHLEHIEAGILQRFTSSCAWCQLSPEGLVDVAIVERGSGPPWTVRACAWCIGMFRILPLAEHPEGSLGAEVLYRPKPQSP